jgi:hypothetical protein
VEVYFAGGRRYDDPTDLFVVPKGKQVSSSDIRSPNSSALKLSNLQPGR